MDHVPFRHIDTPPSHHGATPPPHIAMQHSPPFTREGLADSYISSADLASLNLTPTSTTCAERAKHKRVGFCPLAVLISCGDGTEKDAKGRARIAVRTYSMDTPSLTSAWSKVVSSLSSSLQSLLSPTTSNSVVSISGTPPTASYRHLPSPDSDDENFLPNHSRLSFRLPSLTRAPRPPSASRSPPPCHSILKSPERSTIPLPSPPLLSPSPPLLSTSPTALPSPPLHPHPLIESIPLTPCCASCVEAADLGLGAGYEERWSRGARRKRRKDRQREKEAGVGAQWSGSEEERGMRGVKKVDELAASGVEKGRERRERKEDGGDGKKECEHGLMLEEFEGVSLALAELETVPSPPILPVDPVLSVPILPLPVLPDPILPSPPPELYVPPPLAPTAAPTTAKPKRRFSLSRFGSGIVEAGIAAGMVPSAGKGFS